jgi:hypothetical protein
MAEILLAKYPGNVFRPLPEWRDEASKIHIGDVLKAKGSSKRSLLFLRKYFALLKVGFDYWEPEEGSITIRGKEYTPQKDFERFRKDVIILSGKFHVVSNIRGEAKVEADSIAFGRMSEETFSDLYNATVNVLLEYVQSMEGWSKAEVDLAVGQFLEFV